MEIKLKEREGKHKGKSAKSLGAHVCIQISFSSEMSGEEFFAVGSLSYQFVTSHETLY